LVFEVCWRKFYTGTGKEVRIGCKVEMATWLV